MAVTEKSLVTGNTRRLPLAEAAVLRDVVVDRIDDHDCELHVAQGLRSVKLMLEQLKRWSNRAL